MRVKNTELLRGIGIILILLNHYLGLISKNRPSSVHLIKVLQYMGGDLGVTLFFFMSGFGVFLSLYNMEKRNELSFKTHMKKRLIRILPDYYVALFGIILISVIAKLKKELSFRAELTHVVLIHNIFPSTAQTISGPLWTMGVIVQFYVVAVILYKGINRFKGWFVAESILFTYIGKYIACFRIMHYLEGQPLWLFFWGNRNLFTSVLDEFVIGMFFAYLIVRRANRQEKVEQKWYLGALFIVASVVALYVWTDIGFRIGLALGRPFGYVFHTVLALLIGVIVYFLSEFEISERNLINRALSFVGKYEYTIYLWHYVLAEALINRCTVVRELCEYSGLLAHIILFAITVLWSVLIQKLINFGRLLVDNL